MQGNPTPEGIHKDGHTFISMHMIGRYNIEGGHPISMMKIETK